MRLIKVHLFLIAAILISNYSNATLYRGAEVTYEYINGTTYGFTINTCTKSSSLADHPYLNFDYGAGQIDSVPRIQIIYNTGGYDGQQNIYYKEITFPGPGIYSITVTASNRVQSVINIPGAVNQPICVTTKLVISPFFTLNNSVQFNDFPCAALGCLNDEFCYLPLAYDPDGDSLSFEIIPCAGDQCDPIGGYQPLNSFGGVLSFDSVTGEICWDAPQIVGDYNIAILIHEWRNLGNGNIVEVGSVIRDMQISIFPNCATMGLEENNLVDEISIFPNPANSNLTITINNLSENKIEIYSMAGKLIYLGNIYKNQDLNIANWSNGMYFVNISNGNESLTAKFLKTD